MIRKTLLGGLLLALLAAPARPFWGAFFAGIGQAVGKAIGFAAGDPAAAGLMPVKVEAAQSLLDAAQQRLEELERIDAGVQRGLEYYRGLSGTLGALGGLERYRAPAAAWFGSAVADRHGTSGAWARALNGRAGPGGPAAAYGAAAAPVPDWTAALPTLPAAWRDGVRREHATLELADAASVRGLAVLGELRRLAPQARRAADALERAALDPGAAAHALPALLGKVSVGQVRQLRSGEQANQLLDALLEAELAGLKSERDRLARAMRAAADYRALAAAVPAPHWRMP